jgi:hypothetical protein
LKMGAGMGAKREKTMLAESPTSISQYFDGVADPRTGQNVQPLIRPDYHKTVNKGHGRIEIRECWAPRWLE